MSKPILVVNYCIEDMPMEMVVNNLKSLKRVVEDSGANDDYYTFVLPVRGDSHVQVFYDKDIDNTSFFNMRDLIDERLEELENQDQSDEDKVLEEIQKYASGIESNYKSTKKWWKFWK